MELFALGFIAGIVTALVVLVIALLFRTPLERITARATRAIERVSPTTPKGFVFEPPTEEDERREEILADNSRRGQRTKISDLS